MMKALRCSAGTLLIFFFFTVIAYSQTRNSTVVIAEVMYDSPLNEVITKPNYSLGEFISLFNYGDEPVDISHWVLTDGETEQFRLPEGSVLMPKSVCAVAFRSPKNNTFTLDSIFKYGRPRSSDLLFYQSDLILSNSGENLKLVAYDPFPRIVDEMDYDGTSKVPDSVKALRAANATGTPGDECVSLQRVNIANVHADRKDFNKGIVRAFNYAIYLEENPESLIVDGHIWKKPDINNMAMNPPHTSYQVTSTGAFSYSIPIAMPEGIDGFVPSLSIEYNSQTAYGLLGVGFSLAGLSQIKRERAIHYYDGICGAATNDAFCRFSLDGQRLEAIEGVQGQHNSRYDFVESPSFMEIIYHKGDVPGFTIRSKDGVSCYYGGSEQAVVKDKSGRVFSYLLRKVRNASGLTINYKYNIRIGRAYLKEIEYTSRSPLESEEHGNTNTKTVIANPNIPDGIAPAVRIEFSYKPKPPLYSYLAGEKILEDSLLSDVTCFVHGQALNSYHFSYQDADRPFPLLRMVEQRYQGNVFPPVQFYWSGGSTSAAYFNKTETYKDKITDEEGNIDTDIPDLDECLMGDFDGDGRTDIFIPRIGMYFSRDYGWTKWAGANKEDGSVWSFAGRDDAAFYAQDVNQDGLDDILVCHKDGTSIYLNPGTGEGTTWLWNVSFSLPEIRTIEKPQRPAKGTCHLPQLYFGDFDGDGRTDMATFSILDKNDAERETLDWHMRFYQYRNGKYIYYKDLGETFPVYYHPSELFYWIVADLDKDGKSELLSVCQSVVLDADYLHPKWGEVLHILAYDNIEYDTPIKEVVTYHGLSIINHVTAEEAGKRYHVKLQDVNADGYPDLVIFSEKGMEVYENKGDGFTFGINGNSILNATPDCLLDEFKTEDGWGDSSKTPVLLLDLNQDGLVDILAFDNDMTYVSLNEGGCFSRPFVQGAFSSDKEIRLAGSFDGDGLIDILVLPKEDSVVFETYEYGNAERARLSRIQEGSRPALCIEYGLCKKQFGQFESRPFPLIPMNTIDVVSSVYREKEGEVRERNSYEYTDGIYHLGKQAFLGFCELKATTPQGIVTTSTYSLASDKSKLQLTGEENILSSKKYSYRNDTAWYGKAYPVIHTLQTTDKLTGTSIQTVHDDDAYGNTLWEKQSVGSISGLGSFTSESENTVFYEYGSFGGWGCPNLPVRKIIRSGYVGKASLCDTVHMEYDSKGRMTAQRKRQGVTRYSYYSTGLPRTQTYESAARPGIILSQHFNYTSDSRFLRSVSDTTGTRYYHYDSISGNLLSETDIRQRTTCYEYDCWGRKIKTLNPDGYLVVYTQDWATGEHPTTAAYYIEESISPGISTQTYYDIWNNEIGSSTTVGGQRSFIIKVYDTLGRLVSQSEPAFSKVGGTMHYFEYDNANRVVKENFQNRTTLYRYDGLETVVTRPDGIVQGKRKNHTGDLIKSFDLMSDGVMTGIEYEYLYPGLVSSIISEGIETTIAYDNHGRQILLADPSAGNTSYAYNASDEIVSSVDAKGNITSHFYDYQGRVTSTFIGETNVVVQYGTTGNGKNLPIRKELDSACYFTYEYDADGKLRRKTLNHRGKTWTFFYNYDHLERLSSLIYPNSYALYYQYDEENRVCKITDNLNRTLWEKPVYDANGRIVAYTIGDDFYCMAEYNNYGRVIAVACENAERNELFSETYTYDDKSINLIQRNFFCIASNAKNKQFIEEHFKYDSWGRLIHSQVETDSTGVSIEYDVNGNILSKSDVGEYSYSADRPFAVNAVKWAKPSDLPQNWLMNQDIAYTPFQRVASIEQLKIIEGNPTLVKAEFSYNPDFERMTMTTTVGDTPAVTQFYFGDYEEKLIKGRKVQYCYVNSPSGLLAVSVKNTSEPFELYYTATDYLGSIRALITEDGKVAERFEFDPWGRRRNPYTHQPLDPEDPVFPAAKSYPDIVSIERGFCGQEHLDDFDLINLNARLYDPILGRFLSPDPFVQQPDNTQNMNRYSYALNNPFNYMDPSGSVVEGFIAWGVVAALAVIGGVVNVAVHAKSTTYVWQDLANFGIGFLISGISSMTGYGIAGLADKAGFIWGGLIGGLSGAGISALTSPLQTGLNNLVAGSPFDRNMGKNITTDILMGFFSGFISGSIQGVLKAKALDLSWWDGAKVTPYEYGQFSGFNGDDFLQTPDVESFCSYYSAANDAIGKDPEFYKHLSNLERGIAEGSIPPGNTIENASAYFDLTVGEHYDFHNINPASLHKAGLSLNEYGRAIEQTRIGEGHFRNLLGMKIISRTNIFGKTRIFVKLHLWDSNLGRFVDDFFRPDINAQLRLIYFLERK